MFSSSGQERASKGKKGEEDLWCPVSSLGDKTCFGAGMAEAVATEGLPRAALCPLLCVSIAGFSSDLRALSLDHTLHIHPAWSVHYSYW